MRLWDRIRATLYPFLFPVAKLYAFVVRIKRVGAAVVIEHGKSVLMVRNTYGSGLWGFPGGRAKRVETPVQAARREVREEVGIELPTLDSLGFFSFQTYDIHAFRAVVDSSYVRIDPGEIAEAVWVPLRDIGNYHCTDVARIIIRKYFLYKTQHEHSA